MKNCVNCGAPLDFRTPECPYCGTHYADEMILEVHTIGGESGRDVYGKIWRTPFKYLVKKQVTWWEELESCKEIWGNDIS